jgi:hypothetical protein
MSTQLDLIVYDTNLSAPLLRGAESGDLVPAEALLAVVEAKSTLTKSEAEACSKAVASLAALEPYGKPFIAPRAGGEHAGGRQVRCQYSVLAFDTNIGPRDWASKEWTRLRTAATSNGAPIDRIDRVAVLTRGMLIPPDREAIIIGEERGVLRDWFLHLTNFLVREAARRVPYDWGTYLPDRPKSSRLELEGHSGPRRSRPPDEVERQPSSTRTRHPRRSNKRPGKS